MGKINVAGVGVLEIEGNEPNANEIEKIKSLINEKNTMLHQNIQAPTGEDIENSFNFKRFLLEAGLSIGGALATGGAALPALAARQGGMLAKPFLAQLAKSAGGSAIGGGAGAGLAQTFDPREDILQEIARGAVEGATAEIIGAPIAVKGAQYLNKYLSAPAKKPKLLPGAQEAEDAIVRRSQDIMLKETIKSGNRKGFENLVDDFAKTGRKDIGDFDTLTESFKGMTKEEVRALDFAREGVKGLTPGIKTSTRSLEILENIAQKSLIGGGDITRRYEAVREIGNLLASDYITNLQRVAGPDTMGEIFFKSLAGAEDTFKSARAGAFAAVDDAMAAAGLKNFGIVPFGKLTMGVKRGEKLAQMAKAQTQTAESLDDFLLEFEGLGDFQKTTSFIRNDVLGFFGGKAAQQGGSLTLKQAENLRIALNNQIGRLNKQGRGKEVGILTAVRNRIDDELDLVSKLDDKTFEAAYKVKPPKDALLKLQNAIKFSALGAEKFNKYQIKQILSKGLDTTAGTVDDIFQTVVRGGSKPESVKKILTNLDELTKTIDPLTKRPLMTTQQVTQMKDSLKGQLMMNIYNKALKPTGSQYGGKFVDASSFSNSLDEYEPIITQLFKGKELDELIALDNQLKFAYGELSRLGGLPGGVFIQLKQAGAATQMLQLGAGGFVAGGLLGPLDAPTVAILLGPAALAKVLLKPKINKGLFSKETLKNLSNPDPNAAMAASIVAFRQTIGGMLNDGIIDKATADKALADTKKVEDYYKVNKLPILQKATNQNVADSPDDISPETPTQTPLNLPELTTPLPNVQPSNVGALFPQDGLSQAIAANRAPAQLKVGGIVSAKKN
jgi:hypothetical protein